MIITRHECEDNEEFKCDECGRKGRVYYKITGNQESKQYLSDICVCHKCKTLLPQRINAALSRLSRNMKKDRERRKIHESFL